MREVVAVARSKTNQAGGLGFHRYQPDDEEMDVLPLHICFNCGGEMVYPLDWSEEGLRHWKMVLRCPECESRRKGVFEQRMVEAFDDELDRAAGVLLGDARRITHANMSAEANFFIRALDADLVTPSDF